MFIKHFKETFIPSYKVIVQIKSSRKNRQYKIYSAPIFLGLINTYTNKTRCVNLSF